MELELSQQEAKPKKSKKVLKPKAQNTEGQYLKNSEILPELLRSQELGVVTPELAAMFFRLTKRYLSSRNFASLEYIKEDLIAGAVLTLMNNALKFKSDVSQNPFSYFTQIVYHSVLQQIAAEKKQRDIRDTLLLDAGVDPSLGFLEKEHDKYIENNAEVFTDR